MRVRTSDAEALGCLYDRMRSAWKFLLLIAALGSPGVALLGAGIYKLVDTYRFTSRAEPAQGRVSSMTPVRAGGDTDIAAVTIDYSVPDRSLHHFTIETNNPSAYSIGQTIEIAVDPGEPPTARVSGFSALWGRPLTFAVVGCLWSGFALFMAVVALRSDTQ